MGEETREERGTPCFGSQPGVDLLWSFLFLGLHSPLPSPACTSCCSRFSSQQSSHSARVSGTAALTVRPVHWLGLRSHSPEHRSRTPELKTVFRTARRRSFRDPPGISPGYSGNRDRSGSNLSPRTRLSGSDSHRNGRSLLPGKQEGSGNG